MVNHGNQCFWDSNKSQVKASVFRKLPLFLFVPFCIFFLTLSVSAHAGKTDASGGHIDNNTGVYHYHHGYPAHQHTGGRCPYDFDDKTGQSSGSPITPPNPSDNDSNDETFSDSEITLAPHPQGSGGSPGGSSSGGSSGGYYPSSSSDSDDFSEAFTWLFIFAIVVGLIAVIASLAKRQKEDEERYTQDRARTEQAEKVRREQQRALREGMERLQRETAARAEQERQEKLQELRAIYDGKHILSFVDIPKGSEIGADNLPKEINAKENWGKLYTFYVTKDGTSFHTKDCHYARYGHPSNALTVSRDHKPCKLCGATLPPLDWAKEYRKIKRLATEYTLNVDFTPPPSWYPSFVIRADQTVLPKSFIASLDPARVKRALEESFAITEAENKESATVTHEGEEEGYTTSFTRCTCRDNSFRHAICKHMIALALHRGVLEIKESKL